LQKMEKNDVKEGRVSGAVYHVSCVWWRCLLFGLMAEMFGREVTRLTR
jgi:hypothetical protein